MTVKEARPRPESFKRPESVLVVVYTLSGEVLLLQRADGTGAWQSVTGSMRWDETQPADTARRELFEETGLSAEAGELQDWQLTNRYLIHPLWKPRYDPEQTHNLEHVFSFALEQEVDIAVNPVEHGDYRWLSFTEALALVRFETNKAAINALMNGDVPW